jgi:hypothetical protein
MASTTSAVMPPGRSTCGGSTVQSTMVLSTPMGARPTVEDVVDPVAEIQRDVLRGGGADLAEAVGRRRSQTAAESAQQFGGEGRAQAHGYRRCRDRR